MSLSEDLAERLLSAIIDGTYPPDAALPRRRSSPSSPP